MSAEPSPIPTRSTDIKVAVGGVVDRITNRVSGKSWKLVKTPTRRAQMPKSLRKSWDQRLEERKNTEIVKILQKDMKDEKKAQKERKRQITLDRQKIKAEKERLEQLAAKMSANKLKRLKKRQGNKKGK